MPAERYYLPEEFEKDIEIVLEGTEFHHLTNVMRNRVGDSVEAINGLGQLATAKIVSISKKSAQLHIESLYQSPRLDKPLILAQAIPRLSKLEIILEKTTELGVTEIWLFHSSHSEKKDFSENQSERLRTILISAMKQCGRLFLPELIMMPPLKQWQPCGFPAFFGDVEPSAPLLIEKVRDERDCGDGVIFFVGPESGFTDDEVRLLKNLGTEGVSLNGNILRAETAAVIAIGLLSHVLSGGLRR